MISPHPPHPMPGPSTEGPGGHGVGAGGGGGCGGDINIHIDINLDIDIHIVLNMNIDNYINYYILSIKCSLLTNPLWGIILPSLFPCGGPSCHAMLCYAMKCQAVLFCARLRALSSWHVQHPIDPERDNSLTYRE